MKKTEKRIVTVEVDDGREFYVHITDGCRDYLEIQRRAVETAYALGIEPDGLILPGFDPEWME